MGSILNIFNNENIVEKENSAQKITKKRINLNNIPNPNFKSIQTLIQSHISSYNILGIILSCYEIYTLNKVENSFFVAFQNKENIIEILKYDFITYTHTLMTQIDIQKPKLIKYFNAEIYNREILIISNTKEIHLFLILDEKSYQKLCIYKEKGEMSYGFSGCSKGILPMTDFLIFFDENNKINYLIISFFFRDDCTSSSKKISILKLEQNNCVLVKQVVSCDSLLFSKKIFLLWENKDTKMNYLIYNSFTILTLLKIDDKETEEIIRLNEELEAHKKYVGCVVESKDKRNLLYLFNDNGLLTIIDLVLNQKVIKLNTIGEINSILNWNSNYLIISSKKYIHTFDITINKIINKTLINSDRNIASIKVFISEEYNFYSLVVDLGEEIISIGVI